MVSIPSNGSIQFLHFRPNLEFMSYKIMSQSPQTGQFNSYSCFNCYNNVFRINVSIPSNGSIQFLLICPSLYGVGIWSQSPQTGQFNSYDVCILPWIGMAIKVSIPSNGSIQFLHYKRQKQVTVLSDCLNPLKRVNSILTLT